jgi:hypothetical protein
MFFNIQETNLKSQIIHAVLDALLVTTTVGAVGYLMWQFVELL